MDTGSINKEAVDQIAAGILEEFKKRGKIIEGGWMALETTTLKGASEVQRKEMRKAYYAGAQHLFASILNILEPGKEPTEADMQVMTDIHVELEAFVDQMKQEFEHRT